MKAASSTRKARQRVSRPGQASSSGEFLLPYDEVRTAPDPDAGLEIGPGEFVWRPAGSRHVAWCPEGGLMLAIFQVPNKFFEADGRVVDAAGQDWDETWGHTARQ